MMKFIKFLLKSRKFKHDEIREILTKFGNFKYNYRAFEILAKSRSLKHDEMHKILAKSWSLSQGGEMQILAKSKSTSQKGVVKFWLSIELSHNN